jgi:hypothetical protein
MPWPVAPDTAPDKAPSIIFSPVMAALVAPVNAFVATDATSADSSGLIP